MEIFITFWLALLGISAQDGFQSTLPNDLRSPATQKLIFQARGVGDQVYTCKAVAGKIWLDPESSGCKIAWR